jgi:hypothetical protein
VLALPETPTTPTHTPIHTVDVSSDVSDVDGAKGGSVCGCRCQGDAGRQRVEKELARLVALGALVEKVEAHEKDIGEIKAKLD